MRDARWLSRLPRSVDPLHALLLQVLGEVHQHGARPPAGGDAVSHPHGVCHLPRLSDLHVPLGHGCGNAESIALLKALVPMAAKATWPLMHRIGTESLRASSNPVVVLLMPGPEVTKTTPTLPVLRA
jgi:hypothetical protein